MNRLTPPSNLRSVLTNQQWTMLCATKRTGSTPIDGRKLTTARNLCRKRYAYLQGREVFVTRKGKKILSQVSL